MSLPLEFTVKPERVFILHNRSEEQRLREIPKGSDTKQRSEETEGAFSLSRRQKGIEGEKLNP